MVYETAVGRRTFIAKAPAALERSRSTISGQQHLRKAMPRFPGAANFPKKPCRVFGCFGQQISDGVGAEGPNRYPKSATGFLLLGSSASQVSFR